MAIAIEGYSIVALKSRIEERFPGGLHALMEMVPNQTAIADDHLWRCSFMVIQDAELFLDKLQGAGLEVKEGPDPDVVTVEEFDQSVSPYCDWIQVSQYQKGVIAWMTGTIPQSIVARDGWTPERGSGLTSADEIDWSQLEFRRLDGNVSVYFDKQKGIEMFIGRTEPDPDEVYLDCSRIIHEHTIPERNKLLTAAAAAKVREAVDRLEDITSKSPDSWKVHFCKGKGLHALGELQPAFDSYCIANQLPHHSECVPRELAGVCLEMGKAEEAVRAGEQAAAINPDNHETLGNLACAYLIAGELQKARKTILAAQQIKADDSMNRLLSGIIEQVSSGARSQPRCLADLNHSTSISHRSLTSSLRSLWRQITSWLVRSPRNS